jgi:hypothetical protein
MELNKYTAEKYAQAVIMVEFKNIFNKELTSDDVNIMDTYYIKDEDVAIVPVYINLIGEGIDPDGKSIKIGPFLCKVIFEDVTHTKYSTIQSIIGQLKVDKNKIHDNPISDNAYGMFLTYYKLDKTTNTLSLISCHDFNDIDQSSDESFEASVMDSNNDLTKLLKSSIEYDFYQGFGAL